MEYSLDVNTVSFHEGDKISSYMVRSKRVMDLIIHLKIENEQLQQEKDNLIKYLENEIKEIKMDMIGFDYYREKHDDCIKLKLYQDILKSVKGGKYEN